MRVVDRPRALQNLVEFGKVARSPCEAFRRRPLDHDPLPGEAGGHPITLQDLGNLGEILGAVGVVVSLVYLAVQVRQNTRSVRASTYQAFSESFRDFRNLLVQEERLGAIWQRGLRSRSELSAAERAQFDALLMNFLRGVEVSFYQEANGLLDAQFYKGWLDEALTIWRFPGPRDWWSENSRFFNPEFCALWDRRLTSSVGERSGGV